MKTGVICLDARMVQSSGIGTYIKGLLSGLRRQLEPTDNIVLLGDRALLPNGPWTIQPVSSPIYSLREQWEIASACRQQNAALLHAPHYNMPWLFGSRTVVTVHDLIHLKFPHYWPSPLARAYAKVFFRSVVPRARAILTVSANTKRDLIDHLGLPAERITITYPAVSQDRFRTLDPAQEMKFKALGLPKDYLLYVGNLKEFKNVERLVEAYAQLRAARKDTPELVMVGRNFISGFENRMKATAGVRWIGEIPWELLPWLYKHALVFLFPSLYEGFGLPPLEAMASGTPVLCSNAASLPEVVGDAAWLVNPESLEEIHSGMAKLIDDGSLRKELSAKGLRQSERFSWEKMADQTLRVYEQCLS